MHPLLPVHVAAGSVALLSGYAALSLRKGGAWHARAGTWFFGSMLVMGLTGTIIALALPERGTATIGILTAYLVATSWRSATRRDGKAGRFEVAGIFVAFACVAALLALGLLGLREADGRVDLLPAAVHFPFAALAFLAAALDTAFVLRGRLSRPQRIARHLWRMCTALLIAAFSFFIGQQSRFPEALQGSYLLLIPPLAVLAAMLFWIVRVRFIGAFGKWARPVRAERGIARELVSENA